MRKLTLLTLLLIIATYTLLSVPCILEHRHLVIRLCIGLLALKNFQCFLPATDKHIVNHFRYTAENSEVWGAPRDTDHPELRQPLAMEVWDSVLQRTKPRSKITVLTNGPLTNLAKVVSVKNISSRIQVSYSISARTISCYVCGLRVTPEKILVILVQLAK